MVPLATTQWDRAKQIEAALIGQHAKTLLNTIGPEAPLQPRRRRVEGSMPKTVGWQKMIDWLAIPPHTVSELARIVEVEQVTAHDWRWLKTRPGRWTLELVCAVTGCSPEDWKREI